MVKQHSDGCYERKVSGMMLRCSYSGAEGLGIGNLFLTLLLSSH